MAFVGVAPPATLTVIQSFVPTQSYVRNLDYGQPAWAENTDRLFFKADSITYRIATQAAVSFDTVPISPPVQSLSWTYDLNFYGPSVKCNPANSTQQQMFDSITDGFANESVFVFSEVNSASWNSSIDPQYLLFSAWSTSFVTSGTPSAMPNVWLPGCTDRTCFFDPLQILIQTSTSSIVCDAVNESFSVTIAYINGTQQFTRREIEPLEKDNLSPFFPSQIENFTFGTSDIPQCEAATASYISHFFALSGLLVGNLTVFPYYTFYDQGSARVGEQWSSISSNIISTALSGCDDIQNSPFKNLPNEIYFNNTFPTQPRICRNQTLLRAIEDLANNITLSYLSSSVLSSPEEKNRSIETSNTVNVYEYNPRNLVLSYGVGFLFTVIAAVIGLYAMIDNGVSHSSDFSAIIATTRNPELDSATRGASLGASPFLADLLKVKLRFGPLLNNNGLSDGEEQIGKEFEYVPHIAFGIENNVGQLKKRGR